MPSHFAFDWGKVLENKPLLWEVARSLSSAGCKLSVISWCGPNDGANGDDAKERLNASGIPWVNIIGFCSGPECVTPIAKDGQGEYEIGQAKARHMKSIGAQGIFDDNPFICRAVRDAGLQAFQVIC